MYHAIDATSNKLELGWLLHDSFKMSMHETARWNVEHWTWLGRIRPGVCSGKRLGAQS